MTVDEIVKHTFCDVWNDTLKKYKINDNLNRLNLKTLKKDIPKLKDAIIIAPKELEKYISRMRTYDYKDFKYMLEKQNIKIRN